jgi:hypothetical protein
VITTSTETVGPSMEGPIYMVKGDPQAGPGPRSRLHAVTWLSRMSAGDTECGEDTTGAEVGLWDPTHPQACKTCKAFVAGTAAMPTDEYTPDEFRVQLDLFDVA